MEQYTAVWDKVGLNVMGWDGMGQYGMGWDSMGWDGMGSNRMMPSSDRWGSMSWRGIWLDSLGCCKISWDFAGYY